MGSDVGKFKATNLLGWGAVFLFEALTNPLVFTTLLGPLVIRFAFKVIKGDLGAPDAHPPLGLSDLLTVNQYAPGVLDYSIQLYTVVLIAVFYIGTVFRGIWKPIGIQVIRHEQSISQQFHEDKRLSIHFVMSGLLLIGCLYFFLGEGGSLQLLELYIGHIKVLGEGSFIPPLGSPLTWLRYILGIHGILIMVLPISAAATAVQNK